MDLPGKRHMGNGFRHCSSDGLVCEFRGRPNLVESVELRCPNLRILTQLPHWIHDVVRIIRQVRSQSRQCRLDLVAIEMKYVQFGTDLLNQELLEFVFQIGIRRLRNVRILDADVNSYRLERPKRASNMLPHTYRRKRVPYKNN